ncbi:hypothetical protein ACFRKB_33885 [Streptomyces scopuliridis]|uniref:hypothetical protein n=1 Tax=Streptomyces scopuliridis TaxID=452529 RepID=UPI0036B07AD3
MATTASIAANTSLASVTLEVADPEAARRFYSAFGVDTYIRLRASEAYSTGFRVPADGTGSHRVVLGSTAETFTDPDGFAWEAAASLAPTPS